MAVMNSLLTITEGTENHQKTKALYGSHHIVSVSSVVCNCDAPCFASKGALSLFVNGVKCTHTSFAYTSKCAAYVFRTFFIRKTYVYLTYESLQLMPIRFTYEYFTYEIRTFHVRNTYVCSSYE